MLSLHLDVCSLLKIEILATRKVVEELEKARNQMPFNVGNQFHIREERNVIPLAGSTFSRLQIRCGNRSAHKIYRPNIKEH